VSEGSYLLWEHCSHYMVRPPYQEHCTDWQSQAEAGQLLASLVLACMATSGLLDGHGGLRACCFGIQGTRPLDLNPKP
jgi:hypothetical protein